MDFPHSMEERHVAASLVTALGKRGRDDCGQLSSPQGKIARMVPEAGPPKPSTVANKEPHSEEAVLSPYPYFHYRDFSTVLDDDPLTPLTAPGRVPNFPAKMHSILSRADLADVVAWMPHGRSWRVLKPREFEIRVIPTYFEHAKFSSFIRQANGWGFRRITQGRDRNSYYHELFLRGLPHLCKMMKRPGVSEKQAADPELEPDFYKISEEHPVPERAEDESILLQCTLQGGPKARMPIYYGSLPSLNSSSTSTFTPLAQPDSKMPATTQPSSPSSQFQNMKLDEFSVNSLKPSRPMVTTNQRGSASASSSPNLPPQQAGYSQVGFSQPTFPPSPASPLAMNMFSQQQYNAADVNPTPLPANNQVPVIPAPNVAAAFQASSAASQFAAGFAAATALSHQQFRTMLGQALASLPANGQQPQQQQQQQQFTAFQPLQLLPETGL